MPYTQVIEGWIMPSSEEEYRIGVDNAIKEAKTRSCRYSEYNDYIKHFISEMEKIRSEFANGILGFTLICLLHRDYAKVTEDPAICLIDGFPFHTDNLRSPSSVHNNHPEELPIYAEVLTNIALKSKKFSPDNISEDLIRANFTEVLYHNRFLKKLEGKASRISKDNVIDLCIWLGWNSERVNYCLLRMNGSCLSANSAPDMIARFVLDIPEATIDDRKKLKAAYKKACKTVSPKRFEEKEIGETQIKADMFSRI